MTRPDRRWFVREAGGEWFLDRGTLLMLVPSLVLASALVAPSVSAPVSTSVLARLLVAGAFGIVVAAVPIELARVGPFRDRAERPVPLLVVVAFSAVAGVVKASGTAWAAAMLGVAGSTAAELALRAPGAATTAAIVLPAVALLRAALERLRAERDVLVAEQLHRLLEGGPVEPTSVDAEVAELVGAAASELAEVAPGTAQAALTSLLEERVRPLVARLAADGGGGGPRVGRLRDRVAAGRSDLPLRRVVRSALHRPVPVLPTAVGVLLANLGRHVATAGPAAASRIAVGAALGAAAGLALPRLLGDRGRGPVGATLGIALAALLSVVGAGLGAVTLAELVVAATLTGHLAIGSAVITSIRHDRAEVRRELLRLLGPDGLRAAVDRARDRLRRRELAEHLHADLQNRLLASLHRVERLAGDEAAVLAELAEVQRHLGLAGRLPGAPAGGSADRTRASSSSESLADRLRALADRWDGFLDVTLDVRGEGEGDGGGGGGVPAEVPAALADRVVRVVAEAITNAVRHGHAGAVRLEVRVGADGVRVIAVDDGTGPRSGPPGGGSAYLDVVAARGSQGARGWSLTADADGGSRLEVLVG